MMYLLIVLLTVFADSTTNYYDQVVNEPIPNDPAVIKQGEQLFRNQCAVCHRLDREVIGPALGSVTGTRPVPWLKDFIRNSQKVITSGDEYANFIFNQYSRVVMPEFDFLTDKELMSILAYIEHESQAPNYTAGVSGENQEQYKMDAPRYNYLGKEDKHGKGMNIALFGVAGITIFATFLVAYKVVMKLKRDNS